MVQVKKNMFSSMMQPDSANGTCAAPGSQGNGSQSYMGSYGFGSQPQPQKQWYQIAPPRQPDEEENCLDCLGLGHFSVLQIVIGLGLLIFVICPIFCWCCKSRRKGVAAKRKSVKKGGASRSVKTYGSYGGQLRSQPLDSSRKSTKSSNSSKSNKSSSEERRGRSGRSGSDKKSSPSPSPTSSSRAKSMNPKKDRKDDSDSKRSRSVKNGSSNRL